MKSDDEVGRQILSIFMRQRVPANGVLRRNHFMDVRDADFQRGLRKAVENHWITIRPHDRYTYELTEAGLAAAIESRDWISELVDSSRAEMAARHGRIDSR